MTKNISFALLLFCLMGCTKKQNSIYKDVKEIAREIIFEAKNCALITTDSTGNAYVRTMDPFLPDEKFTIWMATNPRSLKVKQIQKNSKITLYYFDSNTTSYVTLQGNATLVDAKEHKERLWKKEWENFYKNRTTDYLLIKFTPKKGTIISEKYNILGDTITWKPQSLNFK